VRVQVQDADGAHSLGSGTVFHRYAGGAGLVITNSHVVHRRANDRAIRVEFAQVGGASAGVVVEDDPIWDVAVIAAFLPETVKAVEVRETLVRLGEELVTAGYPKGGALAFSQGRAARYLSASARSPEPYTLEVAGAVSEQGCSGGPIIDADGRLAAVLWGSDQHSTVGTSCAKISGPLKRLIDRLHDRFGSQAPGSGAGRGGLQLSPIQGAPPEPNQTGEGARPSTPTGEGARPSTPRAPAAEDAFGSRLDKLTGSIERLLRKPAAVDAALHDKLDALGGSIGKLAQANLGRAKLLGEARDGVRAIAPALEAIAPALAKLGAPLAAANPATAWLAPLLYAAGGAGGAGLTWKALCLAVDWRERRRQSKIQNPKSKTAAAGPLSPAALERLIEAAAQKIARAQSRASAPAAPPQSAPAAGANPGGATAQPSSAFPELEQRATEYGQQLVQLSGLTGVDPIVAATRGLVFDDELARLAGQGEVAARLADDLKRRIDGRVSQIHPLAVSI